MELKKTAIEGVHILQPKVFADNRGWFMETWSQQKLEAMGIFYNFVQDNQSFSKEKGTIRGVHFQTGSHAQAKLIRCIRGSILDVVVDLRRDSATYKQWVAVELSDQNFTQLLMPRGIGHGFVTLTDEVEVFYKVDNFYCPKAESGIIWNDPELAIDWSVASPILSEKDKKWPTLKALGSIDWIGEEA